jgi:hypothetical protein
MPTKHPRIAVTQDEELSAALEKVAALTGDAPAARVVHDLAVKGAEALLTEDAARKAAIERLIELSTKRLPAIDWDYLENVRDTAWRD